MTSEKDALKILSDADTAIEQSQAEAVRELAEVEAAATAHTATVRSFRETGHGILAAVDARAFLESLDALLFPGQSAINSASADARRASFFGAHRARLAHEARENHLRVNVQPLASAIEAVILNRSKGRRDRWREKMATEIQGLERKELLGESLSVEESRRLDSLDRALADADATFGEANNALRKFISGAKAEDFDEARRLAQRINFESTP
jgi:hypothetical protein